MIQDLQNAVLSSRPITRDEAAILEEAPLDLLCAAADEICSSPALPGAAPPACSSPAPLARLRTGGGNEDLPVVLDHGVGCSLCH